jgi:beta-lactamase regulating signal transducer with metallopeptidase domain
MADAGAHVFAWLATAWLHGLALFAAVWAAERLGALKSLALRETAWRAVLLVPVLSAALQVFALDGSPTARRTIAPAPAQATAALVAAAPAQAPTAPVPAAAAPAPAPAPAPVAAASLDVGAALAPVARKAPAALGWTWAGWVLLAAALIAGQRLRLRRYRMRLCRVGDPKTLSIAADLRCDAELPALRLLDDPGLASPIALAPHAVVLPGWARTALSERQLAALLAHEVRHLARRDPQWRALTGFAGLAALAPHGRIVLRRLEALAEHACDGWSARRTGDGTPLAECIAACLERGLGARAPSLAAAMAQMDSPLLERVRRLLDDQACEPEPEAWRERLLLIGALGAAAVALPGFAIGHVRPMRPILTPAAAAAPVPAIAPVAAVPPAPAQLPAAPLRPARRAARALPAPPMASAIPAAPSEGERAALTAMAEVRAEAELDAPPPLPALAPRAPPPSAPAIPAVPAPPPDLPVPTTPPTPPVSPY